jgi:hypothetical protein
MPGDFCKNCKCKNIDAKIKEFIAVMEKCKLSKSGIVWTSFNKIFEVGK